MTKRIALLALALTAACNGASTGAPTSLSAPSASPSSAPTVAPISLASPAAKPTTAPIPPKVGGPHFRSPEAAMRYLATAWNDGDLVALKHVTDPKARDLLLGMHRQAVNLRLIGCTQDEEENVPNGNYTCNFSHDYPKGYPHTAPVGGASFTVGPATGPGWYMTVYEGCG